MISGGVYQLLADRTNWEALRSDRSLLPVAVEEMLRWVSPIKNMARTATRRHRARRSDASAPATRCCCSTRRRTVTSGCSPTRSGSTSRRTPNDHVAFGFGPHFCLGASLARLELTVVLDRLLDRLPDLALVDDTEPTHRAANFVSGYERMPVRFTPCRPA